MSKNKNDAEARTRQNVYNTPTLNKIKQKKINKTKHRSKNKNDAEARTRQNVYNTLVKKFISLVQEYQEMQTGFKNKYRDRVGRQLKVPPPLCLLVFPSSLCPFSRQEMCFPPVFPSSFLLLPSITHATPSPSLSVSLPIILYIYI